MKKYFKEEQLYYISTYGGKIPTTFTKTQFIDSIQKSKKVRKK